MLCVITPPHPHTHPKPARPKESCGGDGYVCYLDCGVSFMDVCICLNLSNCIHRICVYFVYQLYHYTVGFFFLTIVIIYVNVLATEKKEDLGGKNS